VLRGDVRDYEKNKKNLEWQKCMFENKIVRWDFIVNKKEEDNDEL